MSILSSVATRSVQRAVCQNNVRLFNQVARNPGKIVGSYLPPTKHMQLQVSYFSTPAESLEEGFQKRIRDLELHPKSIGKLIVPGDYVIKKDKKTGKERKIMTDRAYGYFWMMKDLNETESKPILTSKRLVPEESAQEFPALDSLVSLSGETVNLPDFFTRNNRAKDSEAQCTLVAISFKDHGFKLLPSWIEPFKEALCQDDNSSGRRAEVVHLSITEGWFLKFMRSIIINGFKKNTPLEDHDTTLLSFGATIEEFRDILRMHNNMTGYIYLLDGFGRVRFAGSGGASPDEAESLIAAAKEITPLLKKSATSSKHSRGRKVLN